MTPREFIAMGKMFYQRGSSWVSIIMSFTSIAVLVKLYEQFFLIHLGMTISTVLAIAVPSYVVVCGIIGYLDFKLGIMRAEADVGYRAAPLSDKMRTDIEEILRLLKKQA